MATPTWRNVSTGGDGGAARALEGATRTFDRAFGSLQDLGDRAVADARFNQEREDLLEQRDFENSLATNRDERAAEQLLLNQAEGDRAQTRLEDQLLTSQQNRSESAAAEKRNQYRYNREVQDNVRADKRRGNIEAFNAAVDKVLAESDPAEVQSNLAKLARDNGLEGADLVNAVNQGVQLDGALYGLSSTQNAVLDEQSQLDSLQLKEFDDRTTRQLEAVAAGSGVAPQVLDLQRDTESSQPLLNQLNKASDGEATDMYQYFAQLADRPPTYKELEHIAAQVGESNLLGDGSIDLDGWTITGDGYKRVITDYLESVGIGDSDGAKTRRKGLEAYYELKDNQARVRAQITKTQADNAANLLRTARSNNVSRVAGNNEVEKILATPVQSEATKQLEKLLTDQVKNASGARPDTRLPGYLTGQYR